MNQPLSLCFLYGSRVSGIEEILEVSLPPAIKVLSQSQQLPISTVNSVGGGLLPPSEVPDGLSEFLRS